MIALTFLEFVDKHAEGIGALFIGVMFLLWLLWLDR